jgi:hypothetical protein
MVDIIPKETRRTPRWQVILFYASIALLTMVIIGYFSLVGSEKNSQNYLLTLEEEIVTGRTPERVKLEQDIFNYREKLKDFKPFLEEHLFASKFFTFLEENTHPKTFFSEISLAPRDQRANLSGLTESFLSLGQQLVILGESPLVKEVRLTKVLLGEEGGIDFSFDIVLKSDLFKY